MSQYPLSDAAIEAFLAQVRFTADGLIPAIAQDSEDGTVLMMAWMNAEALRLSLQEGKGIYWSRSRQALWRKGETSGQSQTLVDMLVDCDGDTLLLKVQQQGVACHTGRRSCFYTAARAHGPQETSPVVTDPSILYGSESNH